VSRYKGNADKCPHCGMTYRKLNTGLKYHDVFVMLMDYSDDRADWKHKRRGTVLGKWHQHKKELWQRHIDVECTEIVPF
jgi:hypothetical protein